MSIEAMKRIKSLLQDGDKIDSHTISAVVAECDAAILTQQPDNAACKSVQKRLEAQQPVTTDPVAWFYTENGEVMFGHPNGYRPPDARPLVFGDTHPAPGVPDGWVSASDRVPLESDGEVFVRFTDGSIGTAWATYWHGASNEFAQWTHPDPDEDRTVKYWMRAPAIDAAKESK